MDGTDDKSSGPKHVAKATIDDISEFQSRLLLMVRELQEKRCELENVQKELSKQTMKSSEQERMLDCERRSLAGLQMQLDMGAQAIRKKESEAELAVQKATQLEVQLTLANQEVTVLRSECQKLEFKILEQAQKISDSEGAIKKLTTFKNSCSALQDNVKNFMGISEKEMECLKSAVAGLSEMVKKNCIESVHLETVMEHFGCLKENQDVEFKKAKKMIIEKECKIEKLEQKNRDLEAVKSNPLEASVRELKNKSAALEKRLESERAISKQLKEILSKSLQSQETLQRLETEASAKLSKAEAKLTVSSVNENNLKQEVDDLRKELDRLELAAKKVEMKEKSTQTAEQGASTSDPPAPAIVEVQQEKISESALCMREVRLQFQSAITASGEDWSKYLSKPA